MFSMPVKVNFDGGECCWEEEEKKKKNFVVEELGEVRQAHPSRKVLLWASCCGFLVLHTFFLSLSLFYPFFLVFCHGS